MTDDAELRARIEAQVAARRAGGASGKPERRAAGDEADPESGQPGAGAPGSLAPVRPWSKPATAPASATPTETNAEPGGSPDAGPIRPWLRRGTTPSRSVPPPADSTRTASPSGLAPARPWEGRTNGEAAESPDTPVPSNPEIVLHRLAAETDGADGAQPLVATPRRLPGRAHSVPEATASPAAYVPDEASVTAYVEAAAPLLGEADAPAADEEARPRRRRRGRGTEPVESIVARHAVSGAPREDHEAAPDAAWVPMPDEVREPEPVETGTAAPVETGAADEPAVPGGEEYPWQVREAPDLDLRGAPTWDPSMYPPEDDTTGRRRSRRAVRRLFARAPEAKPAAGVATEAEPEPPAAVITPSVDLEPASAPVLEPPPVLEPAPSIEEQPAEPGPSFIPEATESAPEVAPTRERPLLARLLGRRGGADDEEPVAEFALPDPDASFERPWLRPELPSPTREWTGRRQSLRSDPLPPVAPAFDPEPQPQAPAPPEPVAALEPQPEPVSTPEPVSETPAAEPEAEPSVAPEPQPEPEAPRGPDEPPSGGAAHPSPGPSRRRPSPGPKAVPRRRPRPSLGIAGASTPGGPTAGHMPQAGISGVSGSGSAGAVGLVKSPDLSRLLEATKPQSGDDPAADVDTADVETADVDTAGVERGSGTGQRARRWLIRTGIIVVIAVVAATLLRVFVVQPYYIPSESMEPTLHGCTGCNDDRILVDKISYRAHDVKAFDIVVFHRPGDASYIPDKVLIKRVIGLPGQVVELKQGLVYVNGLPIDEPYINKDCGAHPTNPLTRVSRWKIPADDVFVMGDNRCQSEDSRQFGPIPRSSIIGRAFAIIWPWGHISLLRGP